MPDKSYAERLVHERTGRDVPDLLRDLYVERRYSQQEIADHLGVSRGAIVGWLNRYGISRDDRTPLEPVA
jgi:transposase